MVGEADKIQWRACAHHDAAFAQKEPHFAVRQGFFELGNAWVVQLDRWKHYLRVLRCVSRIECRWILEAAHRNVLCLLHHGRENRNEPSVMLI